MVLNFGLPRPLTWKFQVADVTQPIIGADFLLQHKLLVDLDQKHLIDTQNGARIPAESPPTSLPSIHLLSTRPPDNDPSLSAAAMLVHPQQNVPTCITTDASNSAVGGVLEQFIDGQWKPISFFSKKLCNAELNYSTFDRELLAIYLTV